MTAKLDDINYVHGKGIKYLYFLLFEIVIFILYPRPAYPSH